MTSERNIYLIGFMGAGKTSVGRRLAQRLGYAFVDLDQALVSREGRSIAEIFASDGESRFRVLESQVLAEHAEFSRTVVATGGGIVIREANRELMKRSGTVVYLKASWPAIEQRLARGDGRPLADQQDGFAKARALWESRQGWYEEADLTVASDSGSISEVVWAIISGLHLAGR